MPYFIIDKDGNLCYDSLAINRRKRIQPCHSTRSASPAIAAAPAPRDRGFPETASGNDTRETAMKRGKTHGDSMTRDEIAAALRAEVERFIRTLPDVEYVAWECHDGREESLFDSGKRIRRCELSTLEWKGDGDEESGEEN